MQTKELTKQLVEDIFNNPEEINELFQMYFEEKSPDFRPQEEHYSLEKYEGRFEEPALIGELELEDGTELKFFTIKVKESLTERTSKRQQYEIAKDLLKIENADAGIFIFYDEEGNFRFSFVYAEYKGTKREFSYYKRYTYFVSKDQPNRTFILQLDEAEFVSLDKIKEAFSLKQLTREFYNEIQDWYAWALKELNEGKAFYPGGRNEENLIRLITRLIFVWFLKERNLIPEEIFEEEKLNEIVKDFKTSNNYYNVILQNLFFATLNRYPQDRKFAIEGNFPENREHFGVKTLYRYGNKLKIPKEEFIKLLEPVPFINGGLFECLDKDKDYVDGFSRNEKKRAKLPDYLFFSNERDIDLTFFYGSKKKSKVKGFINILKEYNFTADESSPIDVEVSLDPELLGHIFENLLASFNPETQSTARKATGSYYTPKEIVDFMVDEALIQYFKNKTGIDEGKLRELLSYNENQSLTDEEKQQVINAIDELKIIDPAVGSGAFPMGVLHKLVYILHKLDPKNKLWKEKQLKRLERVEKEISQIQDVIRRNELLEGIQQEKEALEKAFQNELDYSRKLFLIENSIYGVDIQPIAIQIAKLRFFLSLLIDQKIDKDIENYGIQPLPNLETKFVSANTLIGLEKSQQGLLFKTQEIIALEEEYKELMKSYFSASNRGQKKKLQEKAKKIREKLAEELRKIGFSDEITEKIVNFDIFDQLSSADWFDPEWMFGITDGFDIVIGNPPYGNLLNKHKNKEVNAKRFIEKYYKYSTSSDISSPFIEKGVNLLKEKGNLFYIITFAITFNKKFSGNRKQLFDNFEKTKIYSFDRDRCRIFESMTQSVSILMSSNKNKDINKGIFTSRMFRETPNLYSIEVSKADDYLLPIGANYSQPHRLPKLGERKNVEILDRLLDNKEKVEKIIKKSGKRLWIRTSGNYWYNAFDRKPYESSEIKPIHVDELYYDFLLLLINSSLFYFWLRIYGDGRHMNGDILEEFPLPNGDSVLENIDLLNSLKERFMEKLFNVFDEQRNRFLTSNVKDEIDLIDLVLCTKIYNLSLEDWKHIANYDYEIRGGLKINTKNSIDVDDLIDRFLK